MHHGTSQLYNSVSVSMVYTTECCNLVPAALGCVYPIETSTSLYNLYLMHTYEVQHWVISTNLGMKYRQNNVHRSTLLTKSTKTGCFCAHTCVRIERAGKPIQIWSAEVHRRLHIMDGCQVYSQCYWCLHFYLPTTIQRTIAFSRHSHNNSSLECSNFWKIGMQHCQIHRSNCSCIQWFLSRKIWWDEINTKVQYKETKIQCT